MTEPHAQVDQQEVIDAFVALHSSEYFQPSSRSSCTSALSLISLCGFLVPMPKTALFQTEEVRKMSKKSIWIIVATTIVGVFFLSQFGYAGRGCKNKTGQAGYFPNQTISSGGLDREYNLYVHPRYKHNRPTPLVFLLHGSGQPTWLIEWYSNMQAFADAFKFIVVAPKGIDLQWDVSSGSADVTFIADLIEAISAEYCIHPKRIFATGISLGGGMSYRLACDLSDHFAAIGPVSAGVSDIVFNDVCDPLRAVPVIHFHGTADVLIPYEGGTNPITGILFPPIPQMIETVADRNGCSGETKVVYEKGDVTCIAYQHCDDDATVKHCVIEGGGHNWPGAVDICEWSGYDPFTCWYIGHTTEDIDASREIWKFFAEHAMSDDD